MKESTNVKKTTVLKPYAFVHDKSIESGREKGRKHSVEELVCQDEIKASYNRFWKEICMECSVSTRKPCNSANAIED